jgi:uncharacterized protein (DUF983 family)
MKNTSYWSSFFGAKCPRCRQGDMFRHSAYSLQFNQMHDHCPHCDLKYEVEPQFYQGAMYSGYAISVATILVCFVAITVLFGKSDLWLYFTVIGIAILVLFPINFRYSRVMMLHWFGGVKYEKNEDKTH